jgi:eukaryotic-like serine/threonine-protein kinase
LGSPRRLRANQCLLRHIGDALALVDDSSTSTSRQASRIPVWVAAGALAATVALVAALAWQSFRPRAANDAVTRFYIDAPPGSAFNDTYTATAISPDGRQIAFRVATRTEGPALWLRPLEALTGHRLAGTDGADFPFWSPDGRSLAFFAAAN